MTDPASTRAQGGPGSPRQRQRRVPSVPTVLSSLACFFLIFEFLAFQLRSGRDPAIGVAANHPTAARPRPVVIHRRIIVRRVVEPAPGTSSALVSSGDAGSSSTGPSSSAAAAPAAAAPAAAPAPAPAPVTSSS
jgi:hypothetical protein